MNGVRTTESRAPYEEMSIEKNKRRQNSMRRLNLLSFFYLRFFFVLVSRNDKLVADDSMVLERIKSRLRVRVLPSKQFAVDNKIFQLNQPNGQIDTVDVGPMVIFDRISFGFSHHLSNRNVCECVR